VGGGGGKGGRSLEQEVQDYGSFTAIRELPRTDGWAEVRPLTKLIATRVRGTVEKTVGRHFGENMIRKGRGKRLRAVRAILKRAGGRLCVQRPCRAGDGSAPVCPDRQTVFLDRFSYKQTIHSDPAGGEQFGSSGAGKSRNYGAVRRPRGEQRDWRSVKGDPSRRKSRFPLRLEEDIWSMLPFLSTLSRVKGPFPSPSGKTTDPVHKYAWGMPTDPTGIRGVKVKRIPC